MCNGYNHPLKCVCGWGGYGHTGGSSGTIPFLGYFQKSEYSSYVNPNAKCSICGASVYFYKSQNGGRVFFDELGPPWPKHACTDINYENVGMIEQLRNVTRKLQNGGWTPVVIEQNIGKSSLCYHIIRLDVKVRNRLEVIIYDPEFQDCLKEDVLNQVRQIDDSTLEISSFSVSMDRQVAFEIKGELKNFKRFFEKDHLTRFLY